MTDVANAASTGILVANNTDGTIMFGPGKLTVDTTATNAVTLTNNTGADISFTGELDLTTDGVGATAFQATGGGTLTVSATTNNVTTNGSTGVDIQDMTISTAGVLFRQGRRHGRRERHSAVRQHGRADRDRHAGRPGGRRRHDHRHDGRRDRDRKFGERDAQLDSRQRDGRSNGRSHHEEHRTPATQITNLNNLEINGGTRGIDVIGDGTGELNLTVNDTNVNDSTGFGMSVEDIDTGTITVNNTVFDGNNASAGAVGVRILNSNATYQFDETPATDNTIIRE